MKLTCPKIFGIIEICFFALLILYLFINQYNIPIFDEWELVYLVQHYYSGTLNISVLNAPHNECRMLYPHLLNLVVILITKWQSFYLVLFNTVLLFGFYIVFKKYVKNILISKPSIWSNCVFLLGLFLLFSFKSYESIIMGFALNYYLSVVATFGSFIVLQTLSKRNIAFSCLLAHIATLSYITGFLSWICIILIILFNDVERKAKIRYILFVLFCLFIQLYLYFHQYQPTNIPSIRTFNPLKIIGYSLGFLSNNYTSRIELSIVFSVFQSLSISTAFYLLYRLNKEKFTKSIPLIIFALFGILTSIVTGYGRAADGIAQSLSRRYCTLSLPFTLVFLVSIIIHLEYSKYWQITKIIKPLVILFGIYFLFYQIRYIYLTEERNREVSVAESKILQSDFLHYTIKKSVYPYPEYLESKVIILKKHSLSLYRK
jgi:hypothetical protein